MLRVADIYRKVLFIMKKVAEYEKQQENADIRPGCSAGHR